MGRSSQLFQRYGAVSRERLAQDEGGDLLYTFTRAWSDGTTGIKLLTLERLEKLAALAHLGQ